MMGLDVDGSNSYNTRPVLNPDGKPLVIGGMKQGLEYRILEINNPLFLTAKEPPEVGESISLEHSFSPYKGGMFGYEHLTLFIGRIHKTGHNFVRYFNNVKDLEACLV